MAIPFNTPAVRPGAPSIPISATDRNAQPFQHETSLGLEPILSFPYPILKNLMFYVDEMVEPNSLPKKEIGSRFVPKSGIGAGLTEGMRAAILTHIEPVKTSDTKMIYRFFYVVPPSEQHLYNILSIKKDKDGFTLNSTASTGKFFDGTQDENELKTFYEIQRTFVYLRNEVPPAPVIGSFDPSNESTDPSVADFSQDHSYQYYDAQLVHEEQVQFEEEYLNKVFVRVVRIYKTLPGPVVKELIPISNWTLGQTVFEQGGPGTTGEWKAQNAQRWSREVWAYPEDSTAPRTAFIPHMPPESLTANPSNDGWDKGSFPATQMYTLTGMIKQYSNMVLSSASENESGDCCNPPSQFIRCTNTSKSSSQTIDWTANGDLPPVNPPGSQCSKWSTSSEVVVRESHSNKETATTCVTYDTVGQLWESQVDQLTGNVFPVPRNLVPNPTTDFYANYEQEGYTKEVDAMGNTYYVRRPKMSIVQSPYTVPDDVWSSIPFSVNDFTVEQDGASRPDWAILGSTSILQSPDPHAGYMGVDVSYTTSLPSQDTRYFVATLKYNNTRLWGMSLANAYPDSAHAPGTISLMWQYTAPNPTGPWFSQDGNYKLVGEMSAITTLWAEGASSGWKFPVGSVENIYQKVPTSSEVKFTTSNAPTNVKVLLDVNTQNLNFTVWLSDPTGSSTTGGTFELRVNGQVIKTISIVLKKTSGVVPTMRITQGSYQEYTVGSYVVKGTLPDSIELEYDNEVYRYIQLSSLLLPLKDNVFKVEQTADVPTLVVRQYVNPCFAVDSYMQIPGEGYYRKYTSVENFSFPGVLGGFQIYPWNTRPALNGQQGGKYFVNSAMSKNGYSGPCTAIIEELFSPNGVLPASWSTGVDVQYITNSGSFQSPLVTCNFPSCLHPSITVQVSVGNNDATWLPGVTSYTWPRTNHTTWKPVTMVYVQPRGVGIIARRVTIQPPA